MYRRILMALLLGSLIPAEADAQNVPPIQLIGYGRAQEGVPAQWVARLAPRPVGSSPEGLSIAGGGDFGFPIDFEEPVEFRWSFGDHPGIISTGERPAVSHVYSQSGDYTLRVEAWSQGQLFAAGEREMVVSNERPGQPLIGAVQIDPNGTKFEFTAHANDVDADGLIYEWDFDGGEPDVITDEWRMEHSFEAPGRYPVKLLIQDQEGGVSEAERTITVAGAGDIQGFKPLDTQPTDAAFTAIQLFVSGDVEFEFEGRIRPVAGLHLVSRGAVGGCRFLFTAWDDAHLAHLGFIADMVGLVDGGAIYTIQSPNVVLHLEETEESYRAMRDWLPGAGVIGSDGIGGILERLLPGVGNLPPEVRAMVQNLAGVDPRAVEEPEPVPMPAMSPFGLDDSESFSDADGDLGLLFIPYDRASGRLALQLRNSDEDSDFQNVTLNGEFSLDLQAAQRDGVVLYNQCGQAGLAVDSVAPKADDTFLYNRRPNVAVYLSRDYAAETLEADNFKLTYPGAADGSDVDVDVRLFRRGDMAWIKPTEDLLGGVRYTAWVKTGWDGVLDVGGTELPDDDGTGWYTWSFMTRPDFVPTAGSAPGTSNLSCHVFQTVRDAPLIPDKPAVARIYADWRPHPEVHPDAQLREFTARVLLTSGNEEIASTDLHFVRPDLWGSEGVDMAAAEHTAQLYFTPTDNFPAMQVGLFYPTDPGESTAGASRSWCAHQMWSHTPKMTVQWFLLDANQWRDLDIASDVRPWVGALVDQVEDLAEALFPLSSVSMRYGGVLPWSSNGQQGPEAQLNCDLNCAYGLLQHWRDSPVSSTLEGITFDETATITMAIVAGRPGDEAAGIVGIRGGFVPDGNRIGQGGPSTVTFAIEDDPSVHPRMVEGIVHEMGHSLWLDHLPLVVDVAQQTEIGRVRNEAWAAGDAIVYRGIEGFLMARGGLRGWNKSSTEGNQESQHLMPLMLPGTIPVEQAFIARHQYLKIMEWIESQGGLPGGGD